MKIVKMKLFVLALAIMMFPALSFAQPMMEGAFMSKVTIKLKLDQTVQVLKARDDDGKTIKPKQLVWGNEWMTDKGEYFELKGKIKTFKIGNKEILEWLEDAEVIDGVKGAQIYLIIDEGIYLVVEEADGDIVDISEFVNFSQVGPEILDLDVQEEDTDKNGEKGSEKIRVKVPIGIGFDLEDREAQLAGIMDASGSYSYSEKKDKETMKFDGGNISPLGGYLVDANSDNGTECFDDDCYGLAEGSIKIGKGAEFEMVR